MSPLTTLSQQLNTHKTKMTRRAILTQLGTLAAVTLAVSGARFINSPTEPPAADSFPGAAIGGLNAPSANGTPTDAQRALGGNSPL